MRLNGDSDLLHIQYLLWNICVWKCNVCNSNGNHSYLRLVHISITFLSHNHFGLAYFIIIHLLIRRGSMDASCGGYDVKCDFHFRFESNMDHCYFLQIACHCRSKLPWMKNNPNRCHTIASSNMAYCMWIFKVAAKHGTLFIHNSPIDSGFWNVMNFVL